MPTEITLSRAEGLIRHAEFSYSCDDLCDRVATILNNKITAGDLRMALTMLVEEEIEAQARGERKLALRRISSRTNTAEPPQPRATA
jgi:hypothetical protein